MSVSSQGRLPGGGRLESVAPVGEVAADRVLVLQHMVVKIVGHGLRDQ